MGERDHDRLRFICGVAGALLWAALSLTGCQAAPDNVRLSHEHELIAHNAGVSDADLYVTALLLTLEDAFFFQRELGARYNALREATAGEGSIMQALEKALGDMGAARAEDATSLQRARAKWEAVKAGNWADWAQAHRTTGSWLNKEGLSKEEKVQLLETGVAVGSRLEARRKAAEKKRLRQEAVEAAGAAKEGD